MVAAVFLSTGDIACQSAGSNVILINLLALGDEIEGICCLHKWFQLFSPVSKWNHSHGVEIYGHEQTNPDFEIATSILYGCYPTVNTIPLINQIAISVLHAMHKSKRAPLMMFVTLGNVLIVCLIVSG